MSASTPYALDPLQAYEAVMRFAAKRGRSALRLAMHAAMPEVLRPELLHQMRLNFVPESLPELAVEADVLFAPFCEDLGNGYFRFDPASRVLLLQELDSTYREKPRPRSQRLAAFLSAYVEHERTSGAARLDSLYRDYLEVEAWVALGFLDPDTAAEQLAQALAEGFSPGTVVARARIGAIAGALTVPLAAHRRVIDYAKAVDAIDRGDTSTGRQLIAALGAKEVAVGSVVLPSAAEALAPRVAPAAAPPQAQQAVRPPEPAAAEFFGVDDERPWPRIEKLLIVHEREDESAVRRLRNGVTTATSIREVHVVEARGIDPATVERMTVILQVVGKRSDVWSRVRRWIGVGGAGDAPDVARYGKPVVLAFLPTVERVPEAAMRTGIEWVHLHESTWDNGVRQVTAALLRAAQTVSPEPAAAAEEQTPDVSQRPLPEPRGVHVSDRRRDADFHNDPLRRALTARGYAVSLHRPTPPVGDYYDYLESVFANVVALVVVIGPNWTEGIGPREEGADSHYVREIAYAFRRRIPVVPVLVDGALFPARWQLPPEIHELVERHAMTLERGWEAEGLRRMLDAIDHLTREAPRPYDREPEEPRIDHIGDAAPSESAQAPADDRGRSSRGPTVYICSPHEPSGYAQSLSEALQKQGYYVVIDLLGFLQDSLREVGLMLVFIDRRWADSVSGRTTKEDFYVVREVSLALQANIRILPVLLDGAPEPDWDRLPRELRRLAEINPLALRPGDVDDGVRQLSRVVNDVFGRTGAERTSSDDVPRPSQAAAMAETHAILFIGHTIDRPGRASQRFPAKFEGVARDAIRTAMEQQAKRHPRGPRGLRGIACGSDGGDILFHEVCAGMGIETELFLPIPPDRFAKEFLEPAGGNWTRRFFNLMERVHLRVVEQEGAVSERRPTDYTQDPWYSNGRAMLHAARPAENRSGAVMALWNREWGGPGGPSDLIERARDLGMEIIVLDTSELFGIPPDSYYPGPS